MRATFICQGFQKDSIKLQPWHRVYEISSWMISQGNQVTIITDGDEGQTEIGKIHVIQINNLNLVQLLKPKEIRQKVLETNPDIVVLYGTPFSTFYLSHFRKLGKPFIWDIERDIYSLRILLRIPFRELLNLFNNFYTYFATLILPRFVIRLVANSGFINKIIVPNAHLKEVLTKKGIFEQKIVIVPSTIEKVQPNPLDIVFKKELRSGLGIGVDDFIVTYFGSPDNLRGPDTAILSIPKILKKTKKVKLLILSRRLIGSQTPNEEHNRNEELILKNIVQKLRLESSVKIIPGFMEKQKLVHYLQISDAIVFPFKLVQSEPPISVFEAMQYGKPVIVTNIGCLSEIVGKTRGLLVETGNSTQLADAVLYLINNPDKSESLGEKAKKYSQDLPGWNEVSQVFEKILLIECGQCHENQKN
jgi:glycosyltransferase involved in cell wall biosynthesis